MSREDGVKTNEVDYVNRYLAPWASPRNEIGFSVGRRPETIRRELEKKRDFIYSRCK